MKQRIYHLHEVNRGIKSNMRCIETQMQLVTVSVRKPIKSNMRCIETILESELVLNSDR